MNAPRISVLVSVYNHEAYLAASLQSILDQTYRNFECIIIDDASNDGSAIIIKAFQARDERIMVIHHSENRGLTISLNEGLAQARGQYIARHDADDISLPGRFMQQKKFLDAHPDIFLCATDVDYLDGDNRHIEKTVGRNMSPEDIAKKLRTKNCLLHPTIMFRNDGSRYREKFYYAQDYDFYLVALTTNKRLSLLIEKLVEYRLGNTAISYQNRTKQDAFAGQARIFFHQRMQNSTDAYDAFQPQEILALSPAPNAEERLEMDIVTFYLQNAKPGLARKSLMNAKHIHGTNHFMLKFFVTFPAIYRVYRRYRYS